MKIGIDMGHCLTGADTSANGVFKESDFNRKVGKLVIDKLTSKGHTVVNCTVDSGCSSLYDSLGKRVKIANDNNVDVFCSIHFNAGGGEGTEVYLANRAAFLSDDSYNRNHAIAKRVLDKVVASCNFRNRGVKNEDFYVIYNTKALAILVEICFCDSISDFNKLDCEKVAVAICEGLTDENYNSIQAPSDPQPSNQLYRVRKSWSDVASQVGAYSILENAKKECDARSGYSVFDSNGNKVYPKVQEEVKPPVQETGEYTTKQYSETGVFTCTVDAINFRNNPIIVSSNPIVGQYYKGEKLNYDYVVITNKYVYISWISSNTGVRRYMPVLDKVNNERWGTCI
jgi:N-acetylmuramoyl-L-alanine amidase